MWHRFHSLVVILYGVEPTMLPWQAVFVCMHDSIHLTSVVLLSVLGLVSYIRHVITPSDAQSKQLTVVNACIRFSSELHMKRRAGKL